MQTRPHHRLGKAGTIEMILNQIHLEQDTWDCNSVSDCHTNIGTKKIESESADPRTHSLWRRIHHRATALSVENAPIF